MQHEKLSLRKGKKISSFATVVESVTVRQREAKKCSGHPEADASEGGELEGKERGKEGNIGKRSESGGIHMVKSWCYAHSDCGCRIQIVACYDIPMHVADIVSKRPSGARDPASHYAVSGKLTREGLRSLHLHHLALAGRVSRQKVCAVVAGL